MSELSKKTLIKRKTNVPFTENYKYACEYCSKEFIPNRRRIQKFCSNSCRSKNHRLIKLAAKEKPQLIEKSKNKIEKMSIAGVGNAAAGTVLVEALKFAFTNEENKAATKGDLKNLENKMGRYHRILNMNTRPDGKIPYYDMETKKVAYFYK